jgi:glycosyltransferase involved in cell wall biosynthesis
MNETTDAQGAEATLTTRDGLPIMGSFAPDYAPRVTVIIPSYNYAWCVADAVRSVQAQTLPDWELVIVEDGSTDDSRAVLEALAAEDSRLRLHVQENRGLSAARNAGLWLARGDYIALLDCDDTYLPDKLAAQVATLDSNPDVGMVYADCLLEDGAVWQNHRHEAFTYARLTQDNLVPCQSVMFRRELVQLVGGCDGEALEEAEDWDLWMRLCAVTKTVRLPEPNYVMRRHGAQKSMPTDPAKKARMLQDWDVIRARGRRLLARQPQGKVRVLQAIQSLDGHGAQRVLYNILRHVDRDRFEVQVWTNATGSMAEEIRALGFPVYFAGHAAAGERLLHNLAAAADVVHLHYWGNDFHLPDTLQDTRKLVVTNHCLGNQYRRQGQVVSCWRPAEPANPPRKYDPADLCLHNGIDLGALDRARVPREVARAAFGIADAAPCFVTLSRAGIIKGWDHFCDTAALLFEAEPQAHVYMVGPESCDKDFDKLKAREASFQAAGRDFRVYGNVPYGAAIVFLCAADVVLLTSRSEAFPLTLLEALYLGRPVVGSNVGGIPQIVGPHGACVAVGDVAGYAREALAAVGREVTAPEVAARYNAERMTRRYEEVYRWVCLQTGPDAGRVADDGAGAWNMVGPIGSDTGFGQLNVALAGALVGVGVPVGIINLQNNAALALPGVLEQHAGAYQNAKWALVSTWNDGPEALRAAPGLPLKVSMTEGSRAPLHLVAQANLAYRVLCPNIWNKVVHKACGVQPPISLFRPTLPNVPEARQERGERDGFAVLSVGDMWARKDPAGIVAAFREAFPEADCPQHTLTLKSVRHWDSPNPEDRRVRLRLDHWAAPDVAALYGAADCYLQMAQAEGIGLPVLEAMAAGLPTIYPAHTGMWEFASRALGYPLTWLAQEPAASASLNRLWDYGAWYKSDPHEAALLLRQVASEDPAVLAQKTAAARAFVAQRYNPTATAQSLLAAAGQYEAAGHKRAGRWPLVSVVVLWRGKEDACAWTLQSLQPYLEGRAYEVIMAQGDTLAEALQDGADRTSGEFVLFVQAGVAFETDLPAQLLGTFDYDIGVVCPQRLLPPPRQPGGMVLVRGDGTLWQHDPRRLICNSDAATGVFMVRRDVLRHLQADGAMGGHAEVDLCFQARAAGFRVVCNSEARAGGAGTFEAVPSRSAFVFAEKWRERHPQLFSGWRPDDVHHEPRFGIVPAFGKLSFVILTYNHLAVTQRCLQSIRDTTLRTPYEIVVFDNGSTDGTWEWLTAQPDVRAWRSPDNLGVGGGRNAAAPYATGDLLCFCDNDMEFLPGWELPLLLPFSREDTAAAGPVCWEVDTEPRPGSTDFRALPRTDLYPWADVASGNCLFVRAEVFADVTQPGTRQSGFDPELHRFHEDGEWCLWATAQGYRVVGTPGDCVAHHAHASTGEFVAQLHRRKDADYARALERVRPRLAEGKLRRWLP